jgi:membrane protein required for colicin V production
MASETVVHATTLNLADYLIIGVVLISVIISVVRGFIREAFSLVSWGFAIFLAVFFCADLAPYFAAKIDTPAVRLLVSFGIIFIGTLIIGAIVTHLFVTVVHKSGLSGTDRFIGSIFGLLRGVLVVILVVMIGQFTHFTTKPVWTGSVLIPRIEVVAHDVQARAPHLFSWINHKEEK